jgi:glutamate formiminotransferase
MKMDGVYLLDREMDADHNRCVITLVGEREAIQEAAIRGVGKAAELIDLNAHKGAHPRMGAADVVPFIPIDGVTIEDCVAMARHVGEEIWKRYQIPVYLYEAAAATPERQNLENIRRGQFEISDRLQRVFEHSRCRDREEDCEGGAIFERRDAVREGRRISGARAGAGLDESDGL